MKFTNVNKAVKQFLFEKNFISQEEMVAEGMSSLVTSAYSSYCLNVLGIPNCHIPLNVEGLPTSIRESVMAMDTPIENKEESVTSNNASTEDLNKVENTVDDSSDTKDTVYKVEIEAVSQETTKEVETVEVEEVKNETVETVDAPKEVLADTFVKPVEAEKTIVTNELKVAEAPAETPKSAPRIKNLFGKK